MRRRQSAFTLIELLVVIGIMILLAGILLPVVMKAYGKAARTRLQYDLAAIEGALNAYRQDHGEFPRVWLGNYVPVGSDVPQPLVSSPDRPNPRTGAQVLCWALIGPGNAREVPTPAINVYRKQDGKDGPGFRTRFTSGEDGTFGTGDDSMGKSYGPYLNAEAFRYGVPGDPVDMSPARVLEFCLLDRNDQPILYFPSMKGRISNLGAMVTPDTGPAAAAYCDRSEHSRWDANDNALDAMPARSLLKLRLLLGDCNANGLIDPGETALDEPFILLSAGADDQFGPRGDERPPSGAPDWEDAVKCDDAMWPAR